MIFARSKGIHDNRHHSHRAPALILTHQNLLKPFLGALGLNESRMIFSGCNCLYDRRHHTTNMPV